MKTQQFIYKHGENYDMPTFQEGNLSEAQLVFVIGNSAVIKNTDVYNNTKELYPIADIVYSSSSGAMFEDSLYDTDIVVTALYFEKTKIQIHTESISERSESFELGVDGVLGLPHEGLKHILVFAEGNMVNGDQLAKGAASTLPEGVAMSGGMAGGGMNVETSYVSLNELPSEEKKLVFIGFYGENIQIGTGSGGGWDKFGPKRLITKADENLLYELDGKSALELYELYLGNTAEGLSTKGILFPLSVSNPENSMNVVRGVIGVDREKNCVLLAGEIEEGSYVQLMKASFERLVDGSVQALEDSLQEIQQPDFAFLVSCMGRRGAMQQRTEQEIEAVYDFLGNTCPIAGYYAYGEIGSSIGGAKDCQLHNQTMTITVFKEV